MWRKGTIPGRGLCHSPLPLFRSENMAALNSMWKVKKKITWEIPACDNHDTWWPLFPGLWIGEMIPVWQMLRGVKGLVHVKSPSSCLLLSKCFVGGQFLYTCPNQKATAWGLVLVAFLISVIKHLTKATQQQAEFTSAYSLRRKEYVDSHPLARFLL